MRHPGVKVAAAGLSAALLASGCTVGHARAPAFRSYTPTPIVSPGRVRTVAGACGADQLAAVATFAPVGAGTNAYRIQISDRGRRCVLQGRPTSLAGVLPSGRTVTLQPSRLTADNVAALTTNRPAVLTDTRFGELILLTSIGCPSGQQAPSRAQTFVALRIGVGPRWFKAVYFGGPEPSSLGIWLPCGVAMSNFFDPEFTGLVRADGPGPGAAPCAPPSSLPVTTVIVGVDVPMPRCQTVTGNERLQVENGTALIRKRFAREVTVRLPGYPITRLAPGERITFRRRLGDVLALGLHCLHISIFHGSCAGIWVV